MKALANFPRVERLPDIPGAIKMTGTGYVINGRHVRTVPDRQPLPMPNETRRGFIARVFGK